MPSVWRNWSNKNSAFIMACVINSSAVNAWDIKAPKKYETDFKRAFYDFKYHDLGQGENLQFVGLADRAGSHPLHRAPWTTNRTEAMHEFTSKLGLLPWQHSYPYIRS